MKKIFVGLLALSLALLASGTASAVTVWLQPASQTVSNSAVVTVNLLVDGVASPGVDTFYVELTYNPVLIWTGGSAGVGLFMDIEPDFSETYVQFGPNIDNVNGAMDIALWNIGPIGATGSGTVAVFTFVADAVNTGTAWLTYTSWLLEPSTSKEITHTDSTGDNIIVGGEGPVIPEPATLMLVAAGLAALGGYTKKKRS